MYWSNEGIFKRIIIDIKSIMKRNNLSEHIMNQDEE